ncbi:MAG: hypothetical protein ACRC41_13665 [Sarcina sp.]
MKRTIKGLIFLCVISVSIGAIAQGKLITMNRSVCITEKKDFNLNQLKFVETKLEKVNGQDVMKLKIENTSPFTIAGIDYKYEVNNKIVNVEYDKEIKSGNSSDDLDININNVNIKEKGTLLSANISVLDQTGKIETIEYVKGV